MQAPSRSAQATRAGRRGRAGDVPCPGPAPHGRDDDEDDEDDRDRPRKSRSAARAGPAAVAEPVSPACRCGSLPLRAALFLLLMVCGGIFYFVYAVKQGVAKAEEEFKKAGGPGFVFGKQPENLDEAVAAEVAAGE